jgi:hypothetical protein
LDESAMERLFRYVLFHIRLFFYNTCFLQSNTVTIIVRFACSNFDVVERVGYDDA